MPLHRGHATTVSLRDSAYDRKPETRAAGSSIARRIGAMESVKDTLALARVDAGSVVFYGEADPSAAEIFYIQVHEPLHLGRVLDRIGNQVSQRLRETTRIGAQHTTRHRS